MGLANAPTYGLTRTRFNGRGRKIDSGLAVELGTFATSPTTDSGLTLAQTGNFTPVGPNPVPPIPAGQTAPSGPQLQNPSLAVIIAYVRLIRNRNFWVRAIIKGIAGIALQMVSPEAAARSYAYSGSSPRAARAAPHGARAGCGSPPRTQAPLLIPRLLPTNSPPRPQRCRGPQCP